MEIELGSSYQQDFIIPLKPFSHQIGGHNPLLKLDERTVCKPYFRRECRFYTALPPELAKFTPRFKGVAKVHYKKKDDRLVILVHRVINSIGSLSLKDALESEETEVASLDQEPQPDVISLWNIYCQENFNRTKNYSIPQKFILLENVVSHYRLPCILDIKMGTRCHGDDACPEKRERFIARSVSTTSSSLGVRISGIQVYKSNLGQFYRQDKVFGRELGPQGLVETLHHFFHDGYQFQTQVCGAALNQLTELRHLLSGDQALDSFRFFGCSALLIYEGGDGPDTDSDRSFDLRMIDFAHCTFRGFTAADSVYYGPDHGFLHGIDCLIGVFKEFLTRN